MIWNQLSARFADLSDSTPDVRQNYYVPAYRVEGWGDPGRGLGVRLPCRLGMRERQYRGCGRLWMLWSRTSIHDLFARIPSKAIEWWGVDCLCQTYSCTLVLLYYAYW